jgi:hypothetical protein
MAQDAAGAKPAAKVAQGSGDTAQDASTANQQGQAAYARAMAAYDHGDTQAALAAMLESYRLSGRPELLYNLARLQRELHQCAEARGSFLEYLQRVPDGRYRDNAEQASRELDGECPSADAVKEKPAAPAAGTAAATKTDAASAQHASTANPPGYWTTPRVLAWSAISTGVLGGGAALYFYFAARAARDDVANSYSVEAMGGPPWNRARQDDQHRDMRIVQILGAASGALFTSGALVLLVGPHVNSEPASASIAVAPGLLEARYSTAF